MIEVELKARVPNRDQAVRWLDQEAAGEASIYRDTYYDWPDGSLEGDGGRELRVRVIERGNDSRVLLTYKGAMVDETSTPEHETLVADRDQIDAVLRGLGLGTRIAFEKHCFNFRFTAHGHEIIATLVQVPELGGDTFIEIETLVPDGADTTAATGAIHAVLADLGLTEADLDPTFYVDLVRTHRTR